MPSSAQLDAVGFIAVEASAEKLFSQIGLQDMPPPPFIPVSATPIPKTILSERIRGYAEVHLPAPTYNHSMRVYHLGMAIKRYAFPAWGMSDETYFITCMLHDIGTTEENLRATRMSFELYGGFLAMDLLQYPIDEHASTIIDPEKRVTACTPLADSVVEAIMRHQDIREEGKIHACGQLIQLATTFDNLGGHPQLLSPETVKDVVDHWPRLMWNSCFSATIRKEIAVKPWANSTTVGAEYASKIENNPIGREHEKREVVEMSQGGSGTGGNILFVDGSTMP